MRRKTVKQVGTRITARQSGSPAVLETHLNAAGVAAWRSGIYSMKTDFQGRLESYILPLEGKKKSHGRFDYRVQSASFALKIQLSGTFDTTTTKMA